MHQRRDRRLARLPNRAENAATGRHDLLIGAPAGAQLEFVDSLPGIDRMGVTVDESRADHHASGVDDMPRIVCTQKVVALTYVDDKPVGYGQPAVTNQAHVQQIGPAFWSVQHRAGDKLRRVDHEKVYESAHQILQLWSTARLTLFTREPSATNFRTDSTSGYMTASS